MEEWHKQFLRSSRAQMRSGRAYGLRRALFALRSRSNTPKSVVHFRRSRPAQITLKWGKRRSNEEKSRSWRAMSAFVELWLFLKK